MNWECQLAEAVEDRTEAFVPQALEARNLCRQKKYGKALEVLWGMLRAARGVESMEQEAFVLIHIGKVYRNWMWDVALKYFRDGLALAKACGFKRGEMIANNAIGELYYAWGRPDRSLDHYKRSLETAGELGETASQRDILLDMVECYGEQGEFETCDQLLAEAGRLDAAMGLPDARGDRAGFRIS